VADSFDDLMSSPHLTLASPVETAAPIIFQQPGGSGTVTINNQTALTGKPNNPQTPLGANVPGLGAPLSPELSSPVRTGASPVKTHHWIWIALIVVALIAAYYIFLQPGA
jgi:hypothetical protein